MFFRDFIRKNAIAFGINGTVENEDDRSVKVIAEGEKELLERFIEILKEGSGLAQVEDLSFKWSEATGEFHDFSILY